MNKNNYKPFIICFVIIEANANIEINKLLLPYLYKFAPLLIIKPIKNEKSN